MLKPYLWWLHVCRRIVLGFGLLNGIAYLCDLEARQRRGLLNQGFVGLVEFLPSFRLLEMCALVSNIGRRISLELLGKVCGGDESRECGGKE